MASGTIGGVGQADDINFSQGPEPSCSPVALPTCTDPFLGRGAENPTLIPVVTLLPESSATPRAPGTTSSTVTGGSTSTTQSTR